MPFEKGNKLGKGRPSKADEEKSNTFIINAVKELKSLKTTDEAKKEIVKNLLESQRGLLFLAEHIFGKAPQEIKQTNLNMDAKDLTEKEIKKINKAIESEY